MVIMRRRLRTQVDICSRGERGVIKETRVIILRARHRGLRDVKVVRGHMKESGRGSGRVDMPDSGPTISCNT